MCLFYFQAELHEWSCNSKLLSVSYSTIVVDAILVLPKALEMLLPTSQGQNQNPTERNWFFCLLCFLLVSHFHITLCSTAYFARIPISQSYLYRAKALHPVKYLIKRHTNSFSVSTETEADCYVLATLNKLANTIFIADLVVWEITWPK